MFLTIAKQAALEAAQATGGLARRKKDLPFCTTFLKGLLLAVTLPISIFGVCWWSKFLVGKDKPHGDVATLPDGATVPVSAAQAPRTQSHNKLSKTARADERSEC